MHSFCSFVSWFEEEQIICTYNKHNYELGPPFEEHVRGILYLVQRGFLWKLSNIYEKKNKERILPTLPDALFQLIDDLDLTQFENK